MTGKLTPEEKVGHTQRARESAFLRSDEEHEAFFVCLGCASWPNLTVPPTFEVAARVATSSGIDPREPGLARRQA